MCVVGTPPDVGGDRGYALQVVVPRLVDRLVRQLEGGDRQAQQLCCVVLVQAVLGGGAVRQL
jgi:hypothetical protein